MNQDNQDSSPTDISRWTLTAKETPRWDGHNVLISKICQKLGVTSVIDFGAGNQTIRSHLGTAVRYVPIDCVASTPDVFLCDYNQEFKIPLLEPDACLIFSGFLEYLVQLDEFFEQLYMKASGHLTVFSYAVLPSEPERRIANGWLNNLGDPSQTIEYFKERIENLKCVAKWNHQLIFIGRIK